MLIPLRVKGFHYFISVLFVYSISKTWVVLHQDRILLPGDIPTRNIATDIPIVPCIDYIWGQMQNRTITPILCQNENCKQVTCGDILEGNSDAISLSKLYMENMSRTHNNIDTVNMESITKNCSELLSNGRYRVRPRSGEEEEFPIAYSILMHTNPAQVERLLRAVYEPQNSYCIHVDLNADPTILKSIQELTKCFHNVFIASKLEHIVYGGISRLQADLTCMADMLRQNTKWKYFINLTGQMFPLRTNLEIVRILKIYNGSNDIEGMSSDRLLRARFEFRYLVGYNKQIGHFMVKTHDAKLPPPHDIYLVRGSAYGVFSRAFVEFVLNDQRAKDVFEWSKDTYSPDEHYWATLHHNYENPHIRAPGAFKGEASMKRWLATYAAWGGADPCHGKFVRGVCIFGVGDLPVLMKRKELFANKFYSDFQPLALDCFEHYHHVRSGCPLPFDDSFYTALEFVRQLY